MTISALAEPDARPMRFDAQAVRGWRLVKVTQSYGSALPTEVHMPHALTCKTVHRDTK